MPLPYMYNILGSVSGWSYIFAAGSAPVLARVLVPVTGGATYPKGVDVSLGGAARSQQHLGRSLHMSFSDFLLPYYALSCEFQ